MILRTHTMEVLDEPEMRQIYEAALRVWAQVPLRAQGTPEFMDAMAAFGCRIEGDRIFFPEAVREKTLARIEDVRRANGPCRPADVQSAALSYAASGQALYCADLETDALRPATTQDLADFSRLCDAFAPKLQRAHPTFIPQDVPTGSCDVHAFATILLNSSRPWCVSVYTAEMLPAFIELQALREEAVGIADEPRWGPLRTAPVFAAKCWVNSPYMVSNENIKVAMDARRLLGQPFTISTMPVAGIATPATLSGAATQILAEVLACNVVSLALDDRVMGNCAGPLTFDMRTGIHTQTGPDVMLLRLAVAQMGAYTFGGEYYAVGGPTTASKAPDAQAMMEKTMDALWAICGGARDFGSLGVLAFADIGSPTQLVMDLELMSQFERLVAGVAVDADRIAEDLICETAARGAHFLETDHTARYHREELWAAELLDRRVPMAWNEEPRVFVDNARAKARRLLAEAPNCCPLSDEHRREVARIVAAADRHASATTRA